MSNFIAVDLRVKLSFDMMRLLQFAPVVGGQ